MNRPNALGTEVSKEGILGFAIHFLSLKTYQNEKTHKLCRVKISAENFQTKLYMFFVYQINYIPTHGTQRQALGK